MFKYRYDLINHLAEEIGKVVSEQILGHVENELLQVEIIVHEKLWLSTYHQLWDADDTTQDFDTLEFIRRARN